MNNPLRLFAAAVSLSMFLASCSVSAANWKEIYSDQEEKHFVDSESVKYNGSQFSVWELHDYKKNMNNAPGSRKKFRSRVDQSIGDCKLQGIATIKMYFYEKNMGVGSVVNTLDIPLSIDESPPGSIGREMVDYYCKSHQGQ